MINKALLFFTSLFISVGVSYSGEIQGSSNKKSQTLDGYPEFSWDKIPLAIHFGRQNGVLTDEEVEYVATRASLVTLEKTHGKKQFPRIVDAIAHDTKRLKKENPSLKVLYYANFLFRYNNTINDDQVMSSWLLRTRSGEAMKRNKRAPRGFGECFDIFNSDYRNWWIQGVIESVEHTSSDGVFLDALAAPYHWYIRSRYAHPIDNTKLEEKLDVTTINMLKELRHSLSEQAILLCNPVVSYPEKQAVGSEYVSHTNGAMIEFFASMRSMHPDAIANDIEYIGKASKQNKILVVKAWPASGLNNRSPRVRSQSNDENISEAMESITFPLACYLIAAEKYSYFCYNWGFSEIGQGIKTGSFVNYPEFDKSLGAPKGFEHAKVKVNLETQEASIQWL